MTDTSLALSGAQSLTSTTYSILTVIKHNASYYRRCEGDIITVTSQPLRPALKVLPLQTLAFPCSPKESLLVLVGCCLASRLSCLSQGWWHGPDPWLALGNIRLGDTPAQSNGAATGER